MGLIWLDGIWLGMACWTAFAEIKSMIEVFGRNGVKKGFKLYWGFYNAIDWFNIICSFYIVLLYWFLIVETDKLLAIIKATPEPSRETWSNYEFKLKQTIDKANSIAWSYTAEITPVNITFMTCLFIVSNMLAFFKAFRANPRLDVVTNTFKNSFSDFMHFFVVLFTVLWVFVMTGHLLFGHKIANFSTASWSLDSCMMIMLGFVIDDIRDDMVAAAPKYLGRVWIYLFYLMVLLLLLNMLLAIVFDVYTEVKSDAGDAQAIWTQAYELFDAKKKQLLAAKDAAKEAAKMVILLFKF